MKFRGSMLEFILILFLLAGFCLTALRFIWPRLLAFTILMYSAGALVIFLTVALHAIFGRRNG